MPHCIKFREGLETIDDNFAPMETKKKQTQKKNDDEKETCLSIWNINFLQMFHSISFSETEFMELV